MLNQKHNLLENKLGNSLAVLGMSKDPLDRIPAAQETKSRINKWGHIKLESSAQQNPQREEAAFRMGKKLARYSSAGGLTSRLYKEFRKLEPRNKRCKQKTGH